VLETIHLTCPEGKMFGWAKFVTARLAASGFSARWVGGAVRDLLLNKLPGDVDIVTTALPQDVLRVFPGAELVGASFGVVLVKLEGMHFEVATCREERNYMDGRHPEIVNFTGDFAVDVLRRDLTVNALLYDPQAETVFDYTGGLADLREKKIRMVGDPQRRLSEDYLRMFRAVRFASRLGFEIEPVTMEAIRLMSPFSARVAAERVRDELENMFCGPDPRRALELLKAAGLLKVWLPEVEALSGVEQSKQYHPEGDVWEHTLLMFQNLHEPASAELAWSILLHDIGKVQTFQLDADNVPHFYCHESVGADMIGAIAERLRFSGKLAEAVEHAVRNHMRMASVREMRPAKLRRLLAEKNIDMELELHRLDCCSSNQLMGTWEFLVSKLAELRCGSGSSLPPALISGDDLIRWGYRPGRVFSQILNTVMDAQLEKKITARSEAEKLVKTLFPLPEKQVDE